MTSTGPGAGHGDPRRQLSAVTAEAIRNSGHALVLVDAEGSVLAANDAAGEMLGRPVEQLVGWRMGVPLGTCAPVEVPGSGITALMTALPVDPARRDAYSVVLWAVGNPDSQLEPYDDLVERRLARVGMRTLAVACIGSEPAGGRVAGARDPAGATDRSSVVQGVRQVVRRDDDVIVAGPSETLVVYEIADPSAVTVVARRAQQALPSDADGRPLPVGVAVASGRGVDPRDLTSEAERARVAAAATSTRLVIRTVPA